MLSVVHNPDLLILDEAFSNIDPIFFEKIWGYIAPPSRTVVFTSHNWSTLMHHATKVLFLHRGQQLGTQLSPEEHLSRAPGVKKFVFLYTEGLEQRLKEEKFLTYRLEDKVCVFPGDRAEMLETLGVAALLVGAIELKDIYILSKEGKI
jgi:ABC transporter, ATP-binding protein